MIMIMIRFYSYFVEMFVRICYWLNPVKKKKWYFIRLSEGRVLSKNARGIFFFFDGPIVLSHGIFGHGFNSFFFFKCVQEVFSLNDGFFFYSCFSRSAASTVKTRTRH